MYAYNAACYGIKLIWDKNKIQWINDLNPSAHILLHYERRIDLEQGIGNSIGGRE